MSSSPPSRVKPKPGRVGSTLISKTVGNQPSEDFAAEQFVARTIEAKYELLGKRPGGRDTHRLFHELTVEQRRGIGGTYDPGRARDPEPAGDPAPQLAASGTLESSDVSGALQNASPAAFSVEDNRGSCCSTEKSSGKTRTSSAPAARSKRVWIRRGASRIGIAPSSSATRCRGSSSSRNRTSSSARIEASLSRSLAAGSFSAAAARRSSLSRVAARAFRTSARELRISLSVMVVCGACRWRDRRPGTVCATGSPPYPRHACPMSPFGHQS